MKASAGGLSAPAARTIRTSRRHGGVGSSSVDLALAADGPHEVHEVID
jgi:hypothetical protein